MNIRNIVLLLALSLPLTTLGKEMSILDHPRYGENPIYLFFEGYIQDVIGYLPKERSESFQAMNLKEVFNTNAEEWHAVIIETLHLSKTVDIAILDLWFKNREEFRTEKGEYDPVWFSQIFTDEFMKDDSQVDVWHEGALNAAKLRVKKYQSEIKPNNFLNTGAMR